MRTSQASVTTAAATKLASEEPLYRESGAKTGLGPASGSRGRRRGGTQAGEGDGGRDHVGDVMPALPGVVVHPVLQHEPVDRRHEEPRELVQADRRRGGVVLGRR